MIYTNQKNTRTPNKLTHKNGGGLRWDRFKEKAKSFGTGTKKVARGTLAVPGAVVGFGKDVLKSPKRLFIGLPKRGYQSIRYGLASRNLKKQLGFNKANITQKINKYHAESTRLKAAIEQMQTTQQNKINLMQSKGKRIEAKQEKYANRLAKLQEQLQSVHSKAESYIGRKKDKIIDTISNTISNTNIKKKKKGIKKFNKYTRNNNRQNKII
jgi:hypothetical protein